MFRILALAALLTLPIVAAGAAVPAHAQGCLSQREARSAVQDGQAQSLSRMVKNIQKATGGEILPTPQLCDAGGRLVYHVKVLRPDGQVESITVDAASGNISGY